VKELLWVMERNFDGSIHIKTANINLSKVEKFDFELDDERNTKN